MALTKQVADAYENAFREYRAKTNNPSITEREHWQDFNRRIREAFAFPVRFHRVVLDVMLRVLERAELNESVEQFKETVIASKNFMYLLQHHDFIHEKHLLQFQQATSGYLRSQNVRMLELSKKLLLSRTEEDFNEEWMDAVGMDYRDFWEKHLDTMTQKKLPAFSSIYQAMMRENRLAALPDHLLNKLETMFGETTGLDDSERSINQLLERIANERLLDNRADLVEILDREYLEICDVLEEFFSLKIYEGMEFSVGKFGSVVNGFAMDDADMDITIMTDSYVKERSLLETLSGFLTRRLNPLDYSMEYLSNANVPVIKLKRKPRRSNDIEVSIDVLVNNICGVINSKYLRTYSDLNKSVKYMGVLVKMWAKRAGLITQQRLSSYSFVIMMIYFLVKRNLVPNILRPVEASDYKDTPIVVRRAKQLGEETFQIENYFTREVTEIKYKRKFSLYEQLREFMTFYGENGEFWRGKPLICLDEQAPRELDPEMMLTIKDPFDKPHNPGRAKVADKPTYMEQFQRALDRLKSKNKEKIEAMFK